MATTKPTKDFTEFLPTGFGTAEGVVKNDFEATKKLNGFSANIDDILRGDNLNYMLDNVGKQLKYLTIIADFLNSVSTNKIPYVDNSNQFNFGDINTFLPSQSGKNGSYLSTNGTTCSWSNDFTKIGDPQITLNFNQTLPNNCVWLDGTAGENHDGVVPTTGDWATLFSIYGYAYSEWDSGNTFKLPNFTGRAIWGGTSAGYIGAGIPNVTGYVGRVDGGASASGAFYASGTAGKLENQDGQPDPKVYFNANLGTKPSARGIYRDDVNTVQPPAIKVRVYTRYK